MTPEQIKQLAEELFQIKEIDYAELIGYTHADLREDARMRFADGYTTCQQTEVEPLQKEIERLKVVIDELSKHAEYIGAGTMSGKSLLRLIASYKQQNNL